MIAPLILCVVASVYDGDTIRCTDGTRLRLAGIDAPEIRCPRRRSLCSTVGAIASRDNLRGIVGARVSYRIVDANLCKRGFQAIDPYGRRVVRAYVRGIDLSQAQLRGGYAKSWRCR